MASVFNTVVGAVRVEASMESGKFVDGARKIRTEASKTEAHLKKSTAGMSAALGALKTGIAGFVGALSIGLVTRGIQQALQYASSLKDVSQQLGVTTKDLQTLRFAATQTGVSQQQLDTGLQNLTKTLGQVAAGAERPRKALAAIGITAKDLAGLDTGQAFRKIADGLKNIEDRSQRAAVEVALFGEAGGRLDTMLAGGSERLNELAKAADQLGIVLSDEQIQKADETANKLDALKTVISANIAGAVANNADSILRLANAISELVSQLPNAINQIRAFYHEVTALQHRVRAASAQAFETAVSHPINRFNPLVAPFRAGSANRRSIISGGRDDAAESSWQAFLARNGISGTGVRRPSVSPAGGGEIDPFLAPKGGGGRKRGRTARGPRDRSDDVEFQFAQELRRANMDILRAKQQLARTADDRYALDVEMLGLEAQQRDAELADRVRRAERDFAEGKLTQGALDQVKLQAEGLKAKGEEVDALKRRALDEERLQQQFEEANRLRDLDFDLAREALEAQLQLVDTAAEERDIRLRINDLLYQQERARLKAVLADEQASELAKEEARRRLQILDSLQAADRVGIIRSTMNPLEAWAASIPKTEAQILESFQRIQAQGLDGLSDAITDVLMGTKSLGEAFSDMARSIIADIIQMTIRMLIFRAISSAFGGAFGGLGGGASYSTNIGGVAYSGLKPSFASGGSFTVFGRRGVDKIPLMAGGVHIANVSHGERINVANDGGGPARLIVELRDDMLDARIANGADVQIIRAAPRIVSTSVAQASRSLTRPKLMGRR